MCSDKCLRSSIVGRVGKFLTWLLSYLSQSSWMGLPRVMYACLGLWSVGVAKVRGHSHQSNLDVMGSWGSFGANPSIKGSSAHNLLLLPNAVFTINLPKIFLYLSVTFIKTIAYRSMPPLVYSRIYAVCGLFTFRPIHTVWYISTVSLFYRIFTDFFVWLNNM